MAHRSVPKPGRARGESPALTHRAATLTPASWNPETREVDVVWTTGADVMRRAWDGTPYVERLSTADGAADLARLNAGAPVYDTHGLAETGGFLSGIPVPTHRSQVGKVLPGSAVVEDGIGRARIQFSRRPEVAGLVQDVGDGILSQVSVGWSTQKLTVTEATASSVEVRTHEEWTPLEISMCPLGADMGAGTRAVSRATGEPVTDDGAEGAPEEQMAAKMIPPTTPAPDATQAAGPVDAAAVAVAAVAAERKRAADIRSAASKLRIADAPFVEGLLAGDLSIDAARAALIDKAASAADAGATHPHIAVEPVAGPDQVRAAMVNAILHGADARTTLTEHARQFRGQTAVDLARNCLERAGRNTRGMSRSDIAIEALRAAPHSTSDFPLILADALGKALRAGYNEVPRTFAPIARQVNLPDFKTRKVTQLGEAPALNLVIEGASPTQGTITEARETWSLLTYARAFTITRQAIVNDDLGAFMRLGAMWGAAGARRENDVFWAVVTDNANMADGNALFSAAHNNLAVGADIDPPSIASIAAMRNLLRRQVGLDGVTRVDVIPRFLVGPTALETVFAQFSTQITPALVASAVPGFVASLGVITEPRLDTASALVWYVMAEPSAIDTFEYGYLDGAPGVQVAEVPQTVFHGLSVEAWLDFGAKAIDWRGMARNAGT